MASGCIVGDCPVCDYPVFEDEWSGAVFERYGKFLHIGKCVHDYEEARVKAAAIRKYKKQYEQLMKENEELKKRLNSGQMFLDI